MRYVYLANGRVGLEVLRWLVARDERPSGLVVHPTHRARFREEIVRVAGLPPTDVVEAQALRMDAGREWLEKQRPVLMISVLFGYLLHADVLAIPSRGAINLHTGLLPFNRGAYPNVWTIIDGTPGGVTLHHIDAGIDTGDVVAQRQVRTYETDTGATLYERLENAAIELFKDTWPSICANEITRTPQVEPGTFHHVSETDAVDRIDPNGFYRARDLIDVIRARTFPPYRGAYLDYGDRRIYLRLELAEER